MGSLTLAELAARGGSSEARVLELVRAGVVREAREDGFEVGDVQRVRVAEALDRAGIPFDALARAVALGALSFDVLEIVLPGAPELAPLTFREEAGRLGLPVETLLGLYPAWGLPRPSPDDPVRVDEQAIFDEFARFVPLGVIEEPTLRRAASVSGESARRMANWGMDLFRTLIDEPIRAGGGTPQQVLEAGAAFSKLGEGSLERQFMWLLSRVQEHHTTQYVIELVEEAIERAGIPVPHPAHPPAIAFLDLSGYTSLTEELGDEAAAERALTMARVVQEPLGRHGGQVVKFLGDGVLLHFAEPSHAVACALELVKAVPSAGLGAAHVGISAGPVVWRDGDSYGRAVNVASRTVGVAKPGEVVVTREVVRASIDGSGVTFEDLGAQQLKGVSEPISLFRVSKSAP